MSWPSYRRCHFFLCITMSVLVSGLALSGIWGFRRTTKVALQCAGLQYHTGAFEGHSCSSDATSMSFSAVSL